MCDSSADIHSCEFVVRICHVPPQKKDLTEKYSVVIYEQIRFCEIKSNLNPRFAEKEGDYAGTAEYNAEH